MKKVRKKFSKRNLRKQVKKGKKAAKIAKPVRRQWGLAKRLEHRRVRGKRR